MSKQLAVSSAFSIFAMTAVALFAPGSARLGDAMETGATIAIAAPAFEVRSPAAPAVFAILAD